jgi:hypothetical protein
VKVIKLIQEWKWKKISLVVEGKPKTIMEDDHEVETNTKTKKKNEE